MSENDNTMMLKKSFILSRQAYKEFLHKTQGKTHFTGKFIPLLMVPCNEQNDKPVIVEDEFFPWGGDFLDGRGIFSFQYDGKHRKTGFMPVN